SPAHDVRKAEAPTYILREIFLTGPGPDRTSGVYRLQVFFSRGMRLLFLHACGLPTDLQSRSVEVELRGTRKRTYCITYLEHRFLLEWFGCVNGDLQAERPGVVVVVDDAIDQPIVFGAADAEGEHVRNGSLELHPGDLDLSREKSRQVFAAHEIRVDGGQCAAAQVIEARPEKIVICLAAAQSI